MSVISILGSTIHCFQFRHCYDLVTQCAIMAWNGSVGESVCTCGSTL